MKIICIFCGIKSPRSIEHTWPLWLQLDVMRSTKWSYTGEHRTGEGQIIDSRSHNGGSLKCGEICRKCNNGWMNELEVNFRQIFTRINCNGDEIFKLTHNEKNIIGLWVFKTAIVINRSTNYRKIVPDEHFKFLYREMKLPDNVVVKYVDFSSTNTLWCRQETGPAFSNQKYHPYIFDVQVGRILYRVNWQNGIRLIT